MKKIFRVITLLIIAVLLASAFPISVTAAPLEEDRTVFGETYTLESGRTLNGDLNVFGGVVNIEVDARVSGNMFVMGGIVTIDGTITGDLSVIGGTVTLEDDAVIKGNLFAPASYINQDERAVIEGEQQEGWSIPWGEVYMPRFDRGQFPYQPRMTILPTINRIGRTIALTLVLAGLGALLLLIMPQSTETMVKALVTSPWQILGYGALTAVVVFVGSFILAITVCLIPVAFLFLLAFGLSILVGWLILGYELGKRILDGIFHTKLSPALTAVIGNTILYLLASGLRLIPCLGGFINFIAVLFGLGTIVVTLFGTKPFPRDGISPEEGQVVLINNDPQSNGSATVDTPENESSETDWHIENAPNDREE
jgi:hypothetical protein